MTPPQTYEAPMEALFWYAERDADNVPPGAVLIAGAADERLKEIAPALCVTFERDVWLGLREFHLECSDEWPEGKFPLALVIGGPNHEENLGRLARARELAPRTLFFVANDAGGDRYRKLFSQGTCESKHKCRIIDVPSAQVEPSWLRATELSLREHGFYSCPGLFGWDKIDTGSRLLLEQLPERMVGTGADLGSGYGFLAKGVLDRGAEELHLAENDLRAVRASQRNLQSYRQAAFHWLDLTRENIPRGKPGGWLDWVVLNPPFHRRGQHRPQLGQRILERAAACLKTGGILWMVANSTLSYEPLLEELFVMSETVAQQGGFKVLKAEK